MLLKYIPTKLGTYLVRFRSRLNIKYPAIAALLGQEPEARWMETYRNVTGNDVSLDIDRAIYDANLGFTFKLTGLPSDVDVNAATLPRLLDSWSRIAVSSGKRLLVFKARQGWRDFSRIRFKLWGQRALSTGRLEIAIVDSDAYLTSRYSITPWVQKRDFIENPSLHAPIKRLSSHSKLQLPLVENTDWHSDPVDVVYTWVNGADKNWQEELSKFKRFEDVDQDRFVQNDELKYSIRSVELYAPWVRKIFIFSNCTPPDWFRPSERVQWVTHDEIIEKHILPVFNSHAIETYLHRMPGLAEKFLYFNDDFFLTGFVRPSDFFTPYGQSVCRLESYGTLPYFAQLREQGRVEEWHCAALNSADLLTEQYGVRPTRLHHHAPYALQKSVYETLLASFPDQTLLTRQARFRQPSDFSFTSFFYHHYALMTGKAVERDEASMVVRPTNFKRFSRHSLYRTLRFFCLNDGGGSTHSKEYNSFKKKFLARLYQFKSRAE